MSSYLIIMFSILNLLFLVINIKLKFGGVNLLKFNMKDLFLKDDNKIDLPKEGVFELLKKEISESATGKIERLAMMDSVIGKNLMTPRNDVLFINSDIGYDDLKFLIENSNFRRYPVYSESTDNVLGYVDREDFIINNYSNVIDLIKTVNYILDSNDILYILDFLVLNNLDFCILIDEYGGVSGLITVTDIVNYLVSNGNGITNLRCDNDNDYFLLDGRYLISDLEYFLGISILKEDEDIKVLGGLFLLRELDFFTESGYLFEVLERDGMSVKKVKISLISEGGQQVEK